MRKLLLFACLVAVFGGWVIRAYSDPAALSIPFCEKAPKLDGSLEDSSWEKAVKLGDFYVMDSEAPVSGTTVWLTRDNAWLYVGVKCANPHMAHVEQMVYEHDGPVQRDDSLELFIRTSGDVDADYFHFMVNYAGVAADQRCNKQGLRDRGWNPSWRRVTRRQADGWTAELAIPFFCLGKEDLSGMLINIARTFIEVELDAYGAKRNETRVASALKKVNSGSSYHDFANFMAVSGLGGFKPEMPFAPQITKAEIGGLRNEGGKNFYYLGLSLETATPVAGKLRLEVREDCFGVETNSYAQDMELSGKTNLTLAIPAGELRERGIRVMLLDVASGGQLGCAAVRNTSVLNVLKDIYVGRSYYTVEENADIRVELSLPPELLAGAVLVLERGDKRVAELKGLKSVMTAGVPLAELAEGDNLVKVRVVLEGRELAARSVNVVRLAPRPGYETKMDFINGVWLKDQKPIFPMGILANVVLKGQIKDNVREYNNAMFKYLAEDIGMNYLLRHQSNTDIPAFMAHAEKYGLNVINWKYPTVFHNMEEMKSALGDKVDFNKLDLPEHIKQAMANDKGFWSGVNGSLPLSDRLIFRKAVYDHLKAEAVADAELLRDYKNFIAYYNVDEPNLVNPEDRIAAAEWYWQTVHPIDPYRPKMLLYARQIPYGDNWTRWGDVLGYDVYPGAYCGGVYNDPGLGTAYYACQLRERCRQDHKVMFFVPLSNVLDPIRTPIGLSKAHMLCQAYSAIIYGARGLLYFGLSNVAGVEAWDALRIICTQVKAMTPALVNGDIPQTVKYTPDNFDPRAQKFPMVNAAMFRYPDGDYLMMAVNFKAHAVDTKIQVKGALSGERLFAGGKASAKLKMDKECFKDKIEPYGVRAYRLKLAKAPPLPVEMALDMTPVEDEQAPWVDINGIIRQVMMSKNYMPNPCFERQTNPGVPDFHRPYFCLTVDPYWGLKGKSDWYVDDTVLWNGRPSLRMLKRKLEQGGFKTRGLMSVFYPPKSNKPLRMTFSFYAKSDDPKASIYFHNISGKPTIDKLSPDWKRHHFTFEIQPSNDRTVGRFFFFMPSEGSVIWVNGLQMEQGETPTEFRDDSVLVKKKVVLDPGNLISNPGAECVSAENWSGLEALNLGEFGIRRGLGRSGEYAFCWNGQSRSIHSDWMKIDTNKTYELSGWFKVESGNSPDMMFGLLLDDAQKRPINHENAFSLQGTRMELLQPCQPVDRMLWLKDASCWKTGTYFVAAFGVGENEYTRDVSPRGIKEIRREGNAWSVALDQPCGFSKPAGTPVVENQLGKLGVFLPGEHLNISNDWTEIRRTIIPAQWWPGTAYARVAVRISAGATLLMDDFVFRQAQ